MKNKNLQIVGLEKATSQKKGNSEWDNCIRWTILHNRQKDSKTFDIQLKMIYLSGKRVVSVNGNQKHTSMVSFGYSVLFEISDQLNGQIKQEGVSFNFQLFVNGQSFTQLTNKQYHYQPPSLQIQDFEPSPIQKKQVKKEQFMKVIEPTKQTVKNKIKDQKVLKEEFQEKDKYKSEAEKIKETQKQLMKIMKAQKNKK